MRFFIFSNEQFVQDHVFNWLTNVSAIGLLTYAGVTFAASYTTERKQKIRHLAMQCITFAAWVTFDVYYTSVGAYKIAAAIINCGVNIALLAGFVYALYKVIYPSVNCAGQI